MQSHGAGRHDGVHSEHDEMHESELFSILFFVLLPSVVEALWNVNGQQKVVWSSRVCRRGLRWTRKKSYVSHLGIMLLLESFSSIYLFSKLCHKKLGVASTHLPLVRSLPFADSVSLYKAIMAHAPAACVRAVRLAADPANQPVFFFCAMGKDRTGLVGMLLAAVAGCSDDVIIDQYHLVVATTAHLVAHALLASASGGAKPESMFA